MQQLMSSGISKPRYLCRWWMKNRIIQDQFYSKVQIEGRTYEFPLYEFYCPYWAKPLDFIWKLIFGKPIIKKI